jgi:hypothetical protein
MREIYGHLALEYVLNTVHGLRQILPSKGTPNEQKLVTTETAVGIALRHSTATPTSTMAAAPAMKNCRRNLLGLLEPISKLLEQDA